MTRLLAQLHLGGVPEGVMGLRALELLQGVGVGARVARVVLEGRDGPAGELLELAVGGHVVTVHVP